MSFLFVDRIVREDSGAISGELTLEADSRYINSQGMVLPGVISEAVGQLASWKAMSDGGFSGRPIFLFADRIEILNPVAAGTKIQLNAEIHHNDGETIAFSGNAKIDCKKILKVENCTGYFMKLSELENPDLAETRYNALKTHTGLKLDRNHPLKLDAEISDFETLSQDQTSVTARNSLSADCSFFADHFPRFPVTPIVVVNEIVGQVCQKLLSGESARAVQLKEINGIKIREFIKPTDDFTITATVKERMTTIGVQEEAKVFVQIEKNEKRILRGHYLFSVSQAQEVEI